MRRKLRMGMAGGGRGAGGLHWLQEEPNTLLVKWTARPWEIRRVGGGYVSAQAACNTRIPAGHLEGFIEAFANVYRSFADTLSCRLEGEEPKLEYLDFPTVQDGVRGMAFIETAVASAASDKKWVKMLS